MRRHESSEPHDPTPRYYHLRNLLRGDLASLRYAPGARLPAERELAELYGISRITVRQALALLEREGLIRRRRGRHGGTFVLDRPDPAGPRMSGSFDNLFSTKQVRRIEVLAFEERHATAEVCGALHLPPGAAVLYVERRLLGREGPIAHVRSFMPAAVGTAIRRRDVGRRLLQDLLLESAGAKAIEMRDEIEAGAADSAQARMLAVGVGRPLLLLRRTLLAPGDEPISYTTTFIASERYTITLRQRCS